MAARAEPGLTHDRILFGQAAALSGPAASLGQDMRQGLLAAFEEANRAGGVNGRRLDLVSLDDGYDPDRSVAATNTLVQDAKVFALVGAVGTPTSLATQPIAAEAGVPFIGAFTGAEFLRTPFKPDVVNVRASYFEETEAMVERLVADRDIRRIAVLYQDDAFGRAGLEGVQRALDKRSMRLISEGAFERNTTAIKTPLLVIRASNPEAVILVGPYKPCAAFIKLARSLGMTNLFLGTSFIGGGALAQELGPEGEGVIITQVTPSPWDRSLPMVARYQEAMGAIDAKPQFGFVSLEGYIVGRLVIAALEKLPGELTRKSLLGAIFGQSFDLGGVRLSYAADSNRGTDVVFMSMINGDGRISVIHDLRAPPEPQKAAAYSPPAKAEEGIRH
jgi:ABC-type branched-subunit amino acid transport system substrate-binding protein